MKILIIRFSSFGDVLMTSPVLKKIKKVYPDSEIDFLVYDSFSEAVTDNPNLNNIYIFPKKKSKDFDYINKLISELKERKYDYVIDLHSKLLSGYIGKKLKTNYIKYQKRKWWKTILVKLRLIRYKADLPIVKQYFRPLKKLNIFYENEKTEFFFNLSIEDNLNKKYNLNEEYLILAPGASKNTKKWVYFNELAALLTEKLNMKIYVIGGKEDFGVVKEGKNIIDLCGKLSFKESGALLKHAKFSVTNDSGPFHISVGVDTKTFVIFGPTDSGMFLFGENEILISSNQECSPCSLHGDDECPKKHFNCMKLLLPEQVFEVIKEKINENTGN